MAKFFVIPILIIYPFLLFFLFRNGFQPRLLSILLIACAVFQMLGRKKNPLSRVFAAICFLFAILLAFLNSAVAAKIYPIAVNFVLLAFFFISLIYPPSLAERFARIKNPDLPEKAVDYCRKVTLVWCFFFIINAGLSFATLHFSTEVWTVYNGFISYLLIGLLFTVEFIYRTRLIKRIAYDK
jgi:uncharacterized membrane protein